MSEAANTLRSTQYARVIDLISEGEIGGLVNGLQSVYLDETPLQNPDGSFNFTGYNVVTRNGLANQSYIEGFSEVENEVGIGLKVRKATPIVRNISNENVNAVRVTVSVPSLTYTNASNGDISGTSVQYAIDVQSNGGQYIPALISSQWSESIVANVGSNTWRSTTATGRMSLTVKRDSSSDYQKPPLVCQYRLTSSSTWLDATTISRVATGKWELTYEFQTPAMPKGIYEIRVSGDGITSTQGRADTAADYDVISGKTTSKYQRSITVPLSGSGPWNIRVRRITDDSTSTYLSNDIYFDSYAEIIYSKLQYPNSAIAAVSIDASQFQSIPSRAYDVKLLKVKIPSNYDPEARTYTGIWDGTFDVAWTDNPAWCFYDLLTNERYGLGTYIAADQVDKWSLYQVAQYCDELVDDGFGGKEPRFTCNLYLNSRQDAYKALQDFASIFRGMAWWATGSVTFSQDSPTDAVALYTTANVVEGKFTYSGSSAKMRHTVALVSWSDPDDFYRTQVEYVEDKAGIERYGYVETQVVAVGCTSRGQAHRVGKWLLYTERMETDSVVFRTGLEGMVARPGQVIKIADSQRAGVRYGGRVSSGATTTRIPLDAAPAGIIGGTFYAMLPDGTVGQSKVLTVSGGAVTLETALTTAPQANAVWAVSTATVDTTTYRIMGVSEPESGIYEVSAIAHEPGKYDEVEKNIVLAPRSYTAISAPPDAPQNVTATESLYLSQAEVRTRVSVSWDSVPYAATYEVSYKIGDDNFATLQPTTSNSVDILDATPGTYEIRVVSIGPLGTRSANYATATQQIFGKTTPPADVSGFSMVPMAGNAYLTWKMATDLDVLVGGTVRIRHTPRTDSPDWNEAIDLLPAMSGNQVNCTAPLLAGTYMAKFVDSSGFSSQNAAVIVTTVPQTMALNVINTITESPSFAGAKQNVIVLPYAGGLCLDSAATIDSMTDLIDSWGGIDTIGGVAQAGQYTFAGYQDFGAVYPAKITANITATGFDTGAVIDLRTDLIDSWLDIDGGYADTANVLLYMRTTNDDPSKPYDVATGKWLTAFSRSSTGTYFGADGLLKYAAVDEPRFDFDPVTKAENGLLVEGAATNLMTYSQDFSYTGWTKGNTAATVNVVSAPDGTNSADLVTETAANNNHSFARSNVSILGSTTYTLSVYLKSAGRRYGRLRAGTNAGFIANATFDLVNGTVSNGTIENVGNGWFRVILTFTTQPTATTISSTGVYIWDTPTGGSGGGDIYPGDGVSGFYVWGAQLEKGGVATSYIPTGTATASRSADLATLTANYWTEWKPFFTGEYTARGFQFQLRFTSGSATHNIAVSELSATIDMADRTESLSGLTSGAATYHVAYNNPFWADPAVGITMNNANSGDYYIISNRTAAGFDIVFKNASGTTISRTFDVLAKGYGRKVSA